MMVTIAVFKSSDQAIALTKKIVSKGFQAYVATRKSANSDNGLRYKLVVDEKDRDAARALLVS